MLSLPIAVYGLIVSVIIIGAIESDYGSEDMCPKVGYTKVHSSWCRCGDVVHNNSLADHLCTDVLYP